MSLSTPAGLRRAVTPASKHAGAWRDRLASAPAVAPGHLLGLGRGDVVVAAVAHPDDETLAMGATLARLVRDGVAVHVLAMSAGEAALDHVGVPVPGLAERRRAELAAAATVLGAASARVVGLPDGGLAQQEEAVREAVAAAMAEHGASAVVTLWRDDPHPDHQAVARASVAAAEAAGAVVAELALWTTHWTDPAGVRDEVLLVAAGEQAQLRKQQALECYRTQTEPLADGLDAVLPGEVRSWPHEYVVRSSAPTAPPDFDAMYTADEDPWDVATSWYERRKLALLLATLPREHYDRAWEPGCGPGLVSARLAERAGNLVASDSSTTAVALARDRTDVPAHVRFVRSELPEVPLDAPVDLVVAAEFLYYVPDLPGALDALWSACAPGAHLVFLHWAHRPHDAHRSGPEMHARILLDSERRGAARVVSHVERDFLLDVYELGR